MNVFDPTALAKAYGSGILPDIKEMVGGWLGLPTIDKVIVLRMVAYLAGHSQDRTEQSRTEGVVLAAWRSLSYEAQIEALRSMLAAGPAKRAAPPASATGNVIPFPRSGGAATS